MYLLQKPDKNNNKETTDTIIEKLERATYEHIIVIVGEAHYLLPIAGIKLAIWSAIPDFIRDEHSEEARIHATLRTALKAVLRPLLPELLKKTWGHEVEIVPRLNLLSWLPAYMIHYLSHLMASKEWTVNIEECQGCTHEGHDNANTFKIVGVSSLPVNQPVATHDATQQANREPVQRGREPGPLGQTDNNQLRGSMDSGGGTQVGKVNVVTGTAETFTGVLPGTENLHFRQQQ